MTTERAEVRITLESEIDGEKQIVEHSGEWFCKNRSVFIRYDETETYGKVRTMVRWRDGELNVTRRGDVESDQTFVAGARRYGQYVSPLTRFRLETDTTLLWMQCGEMTQAGDAGQNGDVAEARDSARNEAAMQHGGQRQEGSAEGQFALTLPMLLEWHYTMWIEDQQTGTFLIRLRAERRHK